MLSVNSILKPVVRGGGIKQSIIFKALAITSDIFSRACVHFDLEIHAQQKHLQSLNEISQ